MTNAIIRSLFILVILPQTVLAYNYVWRNVEPGCVPRVEVDYESSNEGIITHTSVLDLAERWNSTNFYYDNQAANKSGTVNISWYPDGFSIIAPANAVGVTVPYTECAFLYTDIDGDNTQEVHACPSYQNIYLRDVNGMPWESCDSGCDNTKINFDWVVMHELGHAMLTSKESPELTYPAVMGAQPPGSTNSTIMTYDDATSLTTADHAYRDNRYTLTGYCQTKDDHCLCYMDDPIADISNVKCDANGVWSWQASQQGDSMGFLIQKHVENGQWRSVHWEPKHDLPRYSVTTPADDDAVYRILDIATSGSRTVIWRGPARSYGLTLDGDITSGIPSADIATENQRLYEAILEEQTRTGRTSLVDVPEDRTRRVLLFYPALSNDWTSRANMLSLFYLYYTGAIVDAIGYNVGTTAQENDQLRDAVQQMILENWPGKKYIHIVGDANDWQEFAEDGPHQGSLWSSAAWKVKRFEYINDLAWYQNGQRDNNLMPTWIEVDPGEPGETMTSRMPYFYTDLPYSDIDADARPDAIVGRWPVHDLTHFDQLISKFARYNQQPYANGIFNMLAYTGDLDYVADSGDGSRAAQLVDDYIAALPAGQTISHVYESDFVTAKIWPYLAESVAAWNNTSPDLALIVSSSSNRYNAGRFFDVDDGWGTNFNLNNNLAVVLGITCGTGDYVTTERNNYGTPTNPVCERFLQGCSGGAVVWIGPTAGTWQYGNSIIARYITEEFYENPYVPMCESFRNAIRQVIDDYSGNDAVKRQARSYVFLGDPMSFPRQQVRPCEVQVSNFYIQPHRTACPRVTLKWNTSEVVECDVEIQHDSGGWVYLGRTTSGTAHLMVYEAQLGISYWTRITPVCPSADTYDPHWTIYNCDSQDGSFTHIEMAINRSMVGASPGVKISYSNMKSMYVKMSVYDVRGQLLKRLVDAEEPAGSHSVVWLGKDESGRSQPSGVYFVLFEGGGERFTQKFTLLK